LRRAIATVRIPVRRTATNFVRFCAASAVLFSHHFHLSGFPEPQVSGFGEDFGEVAVEVFFCLSGS
jgi:peptidoglycan/LPS O-acetylase OafA/YrhL